MQFRARRKDMECAFSSAAGKELVAGKVTYTAPFEGSFQSTQ